MKTCGDGCTPACDHCEHFDFNGEPVKSADGVRTAMVYVGKGRCRFCDRDQDPGDYCEDFHCKRSVEDFI